MDLDTQIRWFIHSIAEVRTMMKLLKLFILAKEEKIYGGPKGPKQNQKIKSMKK